MKKFTCKTHIISIQQRSQQLRYTNPKQKKTGLDSDFSTQILRDFPTFWQLLKLALFLEASPVTNKSRKNELGPYRCWLPTEISFFRGEFSAINKVSPIKICGKWRPGHLSFLPPKNRGVFLPLKASMQDLRTSQKDFASTPEALNRKLKPKRLRLKR